mmetsp:Transcript_101822/g.265591  ORF Transcript_101822/g.265591 Transcript_101822/m.265591 type:complete len:98 (-) Transcript_101822:126-419(-)
MRSDVMAATAHKMPMRLSAEQHRSRGVSQMRSYLECPTRSVDLLHLRCLVCGAFDFLERRQIFVITKAFVVVINAEAKFDHAVDAPCKLRRLVQIEA